MVPPLIRRAATGPNATLASPAVGPSCHADGRRADDLPGVCQDAPEMALELTDRDRAMADGAPRRRRSPRDADRDRRRGDHGARGLLDITSAHIDGCLYHGPAGLDFARRLRDGGGRVRCPPRSTSRRSTCCILGSSASSPTTAADARELMDAYVTMGCRQTWTCAPYQLPERPAFGEHIAWAESNAIVFANSVLGARTDRYGDFMDICCAITGRAPEAGLHLDANGGRAPSSRSSDAARPPASRMRSRMPPWAISWGR